MIFPEKFRLLKGSKAIGTCLYRLIKSILQYNFEVKFVNSKHSFLSAGFNNLSK